MAWLNSNVECGLLFLDNTLLPKNRALPWILTVETERTIFFSGNNTIILFLNQ